MRRLIFIPVLIIIAIIALGGMSYWVYDNSNYYHTDDALVTGKIITITVPTNGKIEELSVKQGDVVQVGQLIALISTGSVGNPALPKVNVTSPINGVILQTYLVPDQNVTAGLTIVQMVDPGDLDITAYVEENNVSNMSIGKAVDVHIDAYGDTHFTGYVKRVVSATGSQFSLLPSTDNASGNFTKVSQRVPIIIALESNQGKNVMLGMSAEVSIHLQSTNNVTFQPDGESGS